MKTIELVKKLEKIDGVKIYHQDFISLSMNGIKIATVGKIGQWLEIETNCPDEVAKTLFEYYLTPLEEREEEKRYILIFPSCFDEFKYLKFNNITKKYSRSIQSFVSLNDVKTIFTQKEIDAMPFDTNFFIKEEVL